MIKNSEVFIIPSQKFGDFYFCPINARESHIPEPSLLLIAIEFEKMLAPNEGRKIISQIHAANVIGFAREKLAENPVYIHSCREGNYVFFINGLINSESEARKLAKKIELEPTKYLSNDIFLEKF